MPKYVSVVRPNSPPNTNRNILALTQHQPWESIWNCLCTPYAFEYMKKQFRLFEKVKILNDIDDYSCTVDAREGLQG